MIKNKIDFEAIENASAKVMTGFRCEPELKLALAIEAEKIGVSLSEYVEHLLQNQNEEKKELHRLQSELKEIRRALKEKEEQSSLFFEEIEKLENIIEQQKDILRIFEHPILLQLFEKIKGQKDEVLDADGKKITIIYNAPTDLLLAMIYSFKHNKSC